MLRIWIDEYSIFVEYVFSFFLEYFLDLLINLIIIAEQKH